MSTPIEINGDPVIVPSESETEDESEESETEPVVVTVVNDGDDDAESHEDAKDIGALLARVDRLEHDQLELRFDISGTMARLDMVEAAQVRDEVEDAVDDVIDTAEVNDESEAELQKDSAEEEEGTGEPAPSEPRSARAHPAFRSLHEWRHR